MFRQVGTAVKVTTTITNVAGTPTPGLTVTLTVLKPDGTTLAPPPTVTDEGAGVYSATILLNLAGLWLYTWASSSGVVIARSDQLTAVGGPRAMVASLEETRSQLLRTDETDDDELREHLATATDWVEWRLDGPLSPQTFTERLYVNGCAVMQRHHPLVSVTSITPDYGSPYAASGYLVDTTNSLIAMSWSLHGWHTVVYRAGRTGPDSRIKTAGLMVVQHLWDVRNGTAGRGFPDGDLVPTPLGFAVPRRADDLLSADPNNQLMPGFA